MAGQVVARRSEDDNKNINTAPAAPAEQDFSTSATPAGGWTDGWDDNHHRLPGQNGMDFGPSPRQRQIGGILTASFRPKRTQKCIRHAHLGTRFAPATALRLRRLRPALPQAERTTGHPCAQQRHSAPAARYLDALPTTSSRPPRRATNCQEEDKNVDFAAVHPLPRPWTRSAGDVRDVPPYLSLACTDGRRGG
jgi:hypothetical protein